MESLRAVAVSTNLMAQRSSVPTPATTNDEGLADVEAASPFRFPRLLPGIRPRPAWETEPSRYSRDPWDRDAGPVKNSDLTHGPARRSYRARHGDGPGDALHSMPAERLRSKVGADRAAAEPTPR